MKKYIGTKVVKALPMNRQAYNDYRGWELPDDEDGTDEGMLVEYIDGGKSNHPDHEGYISWSPMEVFSNAYKETEGMSFGMAIETMKLGLKVARKGWNGKGMYLYYVPPAEYKTVTDIAKAEHGDTFKAGGYITMKPASGPMVIGWLASQTDILAEDWVLVN